MKIHLKDRILEQPAPLVMGILNVTPDSFSDGGRFSDVESALKQAGRMIDEGGHIIDVGGESTRPGAEAISVQEEIDRILPVIQKIKKEFPVLVSIDTYKDEIASCAVSEGGADIINDISALKFSSGMAQLAAKLSVPVILMHIQGTPRRMQENPYYENVIEEICAYFQERIVYALENGISKDKIILDPGIGFGKRVIDNVEILRHFEDFHRFNLPLLLGLSRKSFLGKLSGEAIPENRIGETIAGNLAGFLKGASILRVHDVRMMVSALKVFQKLYPLSNESFSG